MTTAQIILSQIDNGDLPSFADVKEAFPDHPGISWHIRMAAQGSIPDAILCVTMLCGKAAQWRIGNDCKATVQRGDGLEYAAISVTPGHSLIVAAMLAYIAECG